MRRNWILALAAIAVVSGSAAAADTGRKERKKAKHDPNEIICRYETHLGGRLRGRKICGTRADIEMSRMMQRNAMERAQVNRQSN